MTLSPPAASSPSWRRRAAQAVMLLAAALCWLNAAIIAGNGVLVATQTQAITVSVVVALVYALIGGVQFKMQQHLFRLWALPAPEGAQHAALRGLTFFSALFSAGIVLLMLLSLSAVLSRIREGYAIFG